MTEENIQVLLQQVASFDDQNAFRQLFWHYYPSLFQFSRSFVKYKEVAEEIVEDVFVTIWNKRSQLPDIRNLKVYLYVMTRNLSINYMNRSGSALYTNDLNHLDVICSGLTPTPEDLMVASEMLQFINKAIHELPPKCRIIYKLVKEDGLCYKEVSEILGISPRTVENHIAVALRKIAAAIRLDLKTSQAAARKKI